MKRFALFFSTLSLLLPLQVAWAGSCGCRLAPESSQALAGVGYQCNVGSDISTCRDTNLWWFIDRDGLPSSLRTSDSEEIIRRYHPALTGVMQRRGEISQEYLQNTQRYVIRYIVGPCQYFQNNDQCQGSVSTSQSANPIEFQPSVAIPGGETFGEGQKTIISPNTIGEYIRDVVNFLTGVAALLAIVMIMLAGLRWVFSAGSPEKITKAKEGLINALMGLALALGSWTILYLIAGKSLTDFKPIAPTYIQPETDVVTGQPIPEQKCPDCQEITSLVPGVICKNNNCMAAPSVVAALGDFKRMTDDPAGSCPYQWRVTEAWKATAAHSDRAHYNGHAIDVNFNPPYRQFYDDLPNEEQTKINNFEVCLTRAGFRVLNEYKRSTKYTTAPHFHINR